MTIWLFCILAFWNTIVFALYGADKRRSIRGAWRIKESTLLLCAFLLGSLGALLGMRVFRHKTKHVKFRILVPLALLFNIAVIVGGYYFATGYLQAF